jgi:hypothetical protein
VPVFAATRLHPNDPGSELNLGALLPMIDAILDAERAGEAAPHGEADFRAAS